MSCCRVKTHPGRRAEERDETKLRRGELDGRTGGRGLVAHGVDPQVTDGRTGRALVAVTGAAPQHRLDAREEHARAERLGDVVVGTELEPETTSASSPLAVSMTIGTRACADLLRAPADLEAVDAGEHEVEEDEVGRRVAPDGQRVLAVRHRGHGVAFLA